MNAQPQHVDYTLWYHKITTSKYWDGSDLYFHIFLTLRKGTIHILVKIKVIDI